MHRILTMLLLVVPLAACDRSGSITFAPEAEVESTFSTGLDGWLPASTALAAGSDMDLSATGGVARLVVDAAAPGGRAWMERVAILTPGVTYDVEVDFTFASTDGGGITPWGVFAGVSADGGSFLITDLGTTESGGEGTEELTLDRDGTLRITTPPASGPDDDESEIRIAIGVVPTSAGSRSYGLDDVTVRFLRVQ